MRSVKTPGCCWVLVWTRGRVIWHLIVVSQVPAEIIGTLCRSAKRSKESPIHRWWHYTLEHMSYYHNYPLNMFPVLLQDLLMWQIVCPIKWYCVICYRPWFCWVTWRPCWTCKGSMMRLWLSWRRRLSLDRERVTLINMCCLGIWREFWCTKVQIILWCLHILFLTNEVHKSQINSDIQSQM